MRFKALWSWREIGESINRDHSTAIHAANNARDLYQTDAEFKHSYDRIMSYIKFYQLSSSDYGETIASEKRKNSTHGA